MIDKGASCRTALQFPMGLEKGYSTWTTGAKDGLGTAYYDPTMGVSRSNVWYTLSQGVLTEVYYPTVTQANLQMVEFLIDDPLAAVVEDEQSATLHETKLFQSDALIYQQVNTSKHGHYRITKTYTTDPEHDTVYIDVCFEALKGRLQDYNLYLFINPVLTNSAADDTVYMETFRGNRYLVSQDQQTCCVVGSSLPFVRTTAGYLSERAIFEDFVLQNSDTVADTVADMVADMVEDTDVAQKTDDFPHEVIITRPGDIAWLCQVQLSTEPGLEQSKISFTIAIGFGNSKQIALTAAARTLADSFSDVMTRYQKTWQDYLTSLNSPPSFVPSERYYAFAMIIKAHEDKLHPGALVASLSVPWGENIAAAGNEIGGYHLVWARDLYHIATGMAAIGDWQLAKRALAYLDEVQQKPNGSFPQNSWLDGTPYWDGMQLDEAAFPILLADFLGEERYESLVKPAAEFIVENGPLTAQERWEENEGFSPATLAAEIAALVVAAKMAVKHVDFVSAARFLVTADAWFKGLDEWTVAREGRWSEQPYYIRISDTSNPDDGHWVEIKNGGGWHPKSEVVDVSFLELVRLGLKSPRDPLIVHSINVIDSLIKRDSPFGPVWYRYNHDGYGEHENGDPYDGTGVGRLWPLLTGERGEYEVALAEEAGRQLGSQEAQHIYSARYLLATMGQFANEGLLIPEQIWDGPSAEEKGLRSFQGTGSATPLVWAMAQYLRLAKCIEMGSVVEMPDEVQSRYISLRDRQVPNLLLTSPVRGAILSTNIIEVRGRTGNSHVVFVYFGNQLIGETTADEVGDFSVCVHPNIRSVGEQVLTIMSYDKHQAVAVEECSFEYRPPILLEATKRLEDLGDSPWWVSPTNPVFTKEDFVLRGFRISADEDNVYFEIQLGNLDDPWNAPTGISKQLIDIYVDTDGVAGSGQLWTMGMNAQFGAGDAWEKLIRITGNWCQEAHMYNSDGSDGGAVSIYPDYTRHTVQVTVSVRQLGGIPQTRWGFMVLLAGECHGAVRPIRAEADEWNFGCSSSTSWGVDFSSDRDFQFPQFTDLVLPEGMTMKELLRTSQDGSLQLPMLRIS